MLIALLLILLPLEFWILNFEVIEVVEFWICRFVFIIVVVAAVDGEKEMKLKGERWLECHWVYEQVAMALCSWFRMEMVCRFPCLFVDLQRRSFITPKKKKGVALIFVATLDVAGLLCFSCFSLPFSFLSLVALHFTKVSLVWYLLFHSFIHVSIYL